MLCRLDPVRKLKARFDHLPDLRLAAGAQLWDAQRQRNDAGGEAALQVAVAAVRPASAKLVGPSVHHCVHDLLGESTKQLAN